MLANWSSPSFESQMANSIEKHEQGVQWDKPKAYILSVKFFFDTCVVWFL